MTDGQNEPVDAGASDQAGTSAPEPRLRAAAVAADEGRDADDDATLHDDAPDPQTDTGSGPAGPGTAGDHLGGAAAPTGNDGTAGADTAAGDAGLGSAPDPGQAGEGLTP